MSSGCPWRTSSIPAHSDTPGDAIRLRLVRQPDELRRDETAAVKAAGGKIREKARRYAAHMLEAAPDDLVLGDGRVTVRGTSIGLDLAEVAERAWQGFLLPEGMEPGLDHDGHHDPAQFTWLVRHPRVPGRRRSLGPAPSRSNATRS